MPGALRTRRAGALIQTDLIATLLGIILFFVDVREVRTFRLDKSVSFDLNQQSIAGFLIKRIATAE
jgi:hypothetical protein